MRLQVERQTASPPSASSRGQLARALERHERALAHREGRALVGEADERASGEVGDLEADPRDDDEQEAGEREVGGAAAAPAQARA